jgi:protein involved in polysaccharide export with SLBB domain
MSTKWPWGQPAMYPRWSAGTAGTAIVPLIVVALLLLGCPRASWAQLAAAPATTQQAGAEPLPLAQQRQAYHSIAPNDTLEVSLYSRAETEVYRTVVDAAGEITLPEVGHVTVSGMRIHEAAELLESLFAVYYIEPYVDIALLNFGLIDVLVTGPMIGTQVLQLESGGSLFEVLRTMLGGQLKYRAVYVIRNQADMFGRLTSGAAGLPPGVDLPGLEPSSAGLVALPTVLVGGGSTWIEQLIVTGSPDVTRVNTISLLRDGDLSAFNISLRQGDIVYFPKPSMLVEIQGASMPGVYEMIEGETLADLLELSGYTNEPELDLRNVTVERYREGRLDQLAVNLAPATERSELNNLVLQDRDIVRISQRIRQVFVLGEVEEIGVIDYNPVWKITDYIAAAGGMTDAAHPRFITLVRQPRNLADPGIENRVAMFDMELLKGGEKLRDIMVLPGDVIYVPPRGIDVNLGTITSSLNTLFLGLNFFDNLGDETPVNTNPDVD